MRNTLCILTLLLAVAGIAAAQEVLKVDVPFSFYAADRLLPAGVYYVIHASDTDRSSWMLRPAEPESGVFVATHPASGKSTDEDARLIFNKYTEDRVFLNQIVLRGNPVALEVWKGKKEREVVVSTLRAGLQPQKLFVLAMAR
jgi:hypothetical protein